MGNEFLQFQKLLQEAERLIELDKKRRVGSSRIEDHNFQFVFDLLNKEGMYPLNKKEVNDLVAIHGPDYERGNHNPGEANKALYHTIVRMYLLMHGELPNDVVDGGFYLGADGEESNATFVDWAIRSGNDDVVKRSNIAVANADNEERRTRIPQKKMSSKEELDSYSDEFAQIRAVKAKLKQAHPTTYKHMYDDKELENARIKMAQQIRAGMSPEEVVAQYKKAPATKTQKKALAKAARADKKMMGESAMSNVYTDIFFKLEDALEGVFFNITRNAEYEVTLDTSVCERLVEELIDADPEGEELEQLIRQYAPSILNIKGDKSFGRFNHIYDQYASMAAEEVEYILDSENFVSDDEYSDEELQTEIDDMRDRAPSRTIPDGADDEIEESNLSALDRLMWAHSKEVGSGGPKDMRSRHKGYDTETLNKLRSDSVNRDGNSPASLQQRMIDHELRMRGKMKDENDVNEELKRIMELAGQKLDEYDKKLPARNFEPGEEDYPEVEKKKEMDRWDRYDLTSGRKIHDNNVECPNCGASGDTIKFDKFTDNQCYCVGCNTKFKQVDDGWDFDKQEDWDEESKYTHHDDPRRDTTPYYDYDGRSYDDWYDDDEEDPQSEFKFESSIARLKQLSGIVTEDKSVVMETMYRKPMAPQGVAEHAASVYSKYWKEYFGDEYDVKFYEKEKKPSLYDKSYVVFEISGRKYGIAIVSMVSIKPLASNQEIAGWISSDLGNEIDDVDSKVSAWLRDVEITLNNDLT